jgi:hypothetical protein
MKKVIQKILIKKYHNYTINTICSYYDNNKYLLKNINRGELIQYGMQSLCLASKNYLGTIDFHHYLNIYIKYNIFKAITECNPICIIPHKLRTNKEWKRNNLQLYKRSIKGPTYNYQHMPSTNENNENINENINRINDKIQNMDIYTKRIFYLLYDKYSYKKIRTIKRVSELCCVSTEYIRKKLKEITLNN